MKYLLILLSLFAATTVYTQPTEVKPSVENRVLATVNPASIIKRKGFAIFTLNMKMVADPIRNNVNITIVAKCDDYSYMMLLTEGKDEGQDYFKIDMQPYAEPDYRTKLWSDIDKACGGTKKLPVPKLQT